LEKRFPNVTEKCPQLPSATHPAPALVAGHE
jgi:hypothetical protein